ncbi:hypothetical protein jhhlp_003441 [Lomentospora prolificans]|uniref:JmjC domain-containing protein n=1 Tax=Lomentospora prolificans TaxID=41688 RepID=A0A2N3N8Y7_9PEZI|nr:hypothetical protein jhhlp_003441 [Lomentospora prolificans]
MDELIGALHQTTSAILASCTLTPPPTVESHKKNDQNPIAGCGPAVADLLRRQAALVLELHDGPADDVPGPATKGGAVKARCLWRRLDDLLELADAKFLAFRFEVLPDCWRQLYVDVRVLMFHVGVLRSRLRGGGDESWGDGDEVEVVAEVSNEVDELVKVLDMAMIVAGGGPGGGRHLINRLLGLLERAWNARRAKRASGPDRRDAKRQKAHHDLYDDEVLLWKEAPLFSDAAAFEPPVSRPAERIDGVSMDSFQKYIDPATNPEPVTPIIFTDLMEDWPALTGRPWSRPAYLLSRTFGGRRYVPIEIGRSYVDEGWTQKLIPFKEFLETYIDPSVAPSPTPNPTAPPKGYLAQHDLFAQIPSLRNDILLPDYLWTDPPPHPDPKQNKPKVASPQLNAWFGPASTITPLHTDSMHNLLCQVVGRKYVRLYPPSCAAAMRPRGVEGGVDMGNTSSVDLGAVEGWDAVDVDDEEACLSEEDVERFKAAEYWDCVLEPGETLYIPIGWWHYVRSLSVSFSVSFWWN